MSSSTLVNTIQEAIKQAQQNKIGRKVLYSDETCQGKHEFLFFIKPEITMASETIKLEDILKLILNKIDEFGLKIKNSVLLPANYLNKHNIIAQHYGVINAIARDVKTNLSESAKQKFEELFHLNFSKAPIYGGIEILSQYPALTPTALDYLWQNSPTQKLGGGAYVQALKIDGEQVFLVNGFHPRQLEHFVLSGRSIIAFTLIGDLDWNKARNLLIGKTNPGDAAAGSIRRSLLDQQASLGLPAVTSSWNGVHLSAGPVEGLVELIRYNSDFDNNEILSPSKFSFGISLENNFEQSALNSILTNTQVEYKGKQESVFDLTEEENSDKALEMLTGLNF